MREMPVSLINKHIAISVGGLGFDSRVREIERSYPVQMSNLVTLGPRFLVLSFCIVINFLTSSLLFLIMTSKN